jgi:hypothetical protein
VAHLLRVRKLSPIGRGFIIPPSFQGGYGSSTSGFGDEVFEIEAEERDLTPGEITEGLRSGQLRSTDLVLIDGQWLSLRDSAPFGEVASRRAIVETVRRTVPAMLKTVGLLALFLGIGLLKVLLFGHRHF